MIFSFKRSDQMRTSRGAISSHPEGDTILANLDLPENIPGWIRRSDPLLQGILWADLLNSLESQCLDRSDSAASLVVDCVIVVREALDEP